jgi:hypothetical protein
MRGKNEFSWRARAGMVVLRRERREERSVGDEEVR